MAKHFFDVVGGAFNLISSHLILSQAPYLNEDSGLKLFEKAVSVPKCKDILMSLMIFS